MCWDLWLDKSPQKNIQKFFSISFFKKLIRDLCYISALKITFLNHYIKQRNMYCIDNNAFLFNLVTRPLRNKICDVFGHTSKVPRWNSLLFNYWVNNLLVTICLMKTQLYDLKADKIHQLVNNLEVVQQQELIVIVHHQRSQRRKRLGAYT